ncbi:MAG: DUF3876 domain-containing protein [Alistipes sp.]|nr:DUF3876 domain-containing protein [Alistipes sp.]
MQPRFNIGAGLRSRLHRFFDPRDITGRWRSIDNTTSLCIYRNRKYHHGGIHIKVVYRDGTSVSSRIMRSFYSGRYCDLYGVVTMAYDAECDVLWLSDYGDYIREE